MIFPDKVKTCEVTFLNILHRYTGREIDMLFVQVDVFVLIFEVRERYCILRSNSFCSVHVPFAPEGRDRTTRIRGMEFMLTL